MVENNLVLKLFFLFYKLLFEDFKDEKMEDSMEEVVGGLWGYWRIVGFVVWGCKEIVVL